MTTLAEFMIIVDAENRLPMLDKTMYDSWKICMELYIENRDNGRMILNSVENGPLIGKTRKKNILNRHHPIFNKFTLLNHTQQFVAASRFPTTNNKLRTSSNPGNQATIQDGRVTVQQIQGRQVQSYAGTGNNSNATSSEGNNEKMLLVQAQESGQIFDEEQLTFLMDPGFLDGEAVQSVILNDAAFETDDLDAYDSECDDVSTAKVVLMTNISNYGSDVLSEVPHFETYQNDMDNQRKNDVIPVTDEEEILILEEVSRSKMLAKQNDPILIKQKINVSLINYAELNQLSEDFAKCFVPQQELSTEQAFWLQTSNPNTEQSDTSPVKIKAPSELPKTSLVMAAPVILILSYSSEESVVPIAPADLLVTLEVEAVSVISPTEVLDLVDYSSSFDSDPLEDSIPFLCFDVLEADSESKPVEQRPERHESLAPSSKFPLALVVAPYLIRRQPMILVRLVEENGVTRPKKYSKLSATEVIQADCDVKGESLRDFYLRFSLLLNDMNIYNMKLEQFQVNTKFLNTLPPEWSKFVTDIKLVRDLHTTNVDQLHAYLGQHEYHVNDVCIMHERTSHPLALVANHQMNKSPYQPHQQSYQQHQFQPQVSSFHSSQYGTPYHSSQYASQAQLSTPLSITYLSNDFQSSVNHNVHNPSSSIPKVEYAPVVHQQSDFSQPDTGIVVLVFQKLRTSSNPRQQATINNGRVTIQPIQGRQNSMTAANDLDAYDSDCDEINASKIALMANLSHYRSDNLDEKEESQNIDKELALEKQVKELNNIMFKRNQFAQTVHMLTKPQFFYDHSTLQALGFQNPCYLKKAQQLEPKQYNGSVIQKTNAIVNCDSEETLMLDDESRSKMLQKQKDQTMSEKKVNTKPVDYAANSKGPNLSSSTTIIEVPKELPKASMKQFVFITNAPTFDQLFEINYLKAQSQEKDTVIMKLKDRIKTLSGNVKEEKIKRELEEIETINIELDHRVTKLVVENEHLKQTYKQLYDSIKSSRVRSKEQCDDLIKQVNIKSAKNSDLNASLQKKVLVITALRDTLSKLKGKAVVNEAVPLHHIDPELLKIDVAPLAHKLHNNKTAHNDYLRHTQEENATLREILENERLLNPLNTSLDYA
nr:hypothetical protein [Tanacetum cinerariifolium]